MTGILCGVRAGLMLGMLLGAGTAHAGDSSSECVRASSRLPYDAWPWGLRDIAYGIPVDAFSGLMNQLAPARAGPPRPFPAALMTRAAARVATMRYEFSDDDGMPDDDAEPNPNRPLSEIFYGGGYPAPAQARSHHVDAYAAAAKRVQDQEWLEAVLAFDAIVADASSPYRAAAAYSAARAQLYAGHLSDGFTRIGTILADASLAEFHDAARHLVGTLAYRTRDPRLRAAKYAQMLELAFVPPPEACDEGVYLQQAEELEDLGWYLGMYQGPGPSVRVLDELATVDPRFDLLRVLAGPRPFGSPYGRSARFSWPQGKPGPREGFVWDTEHPFGTANSGWTIERWASSDERATTAYAHRRWLETRNFLWALAFAQRTPDPREFSSLLAMLDALERQPRGSLSDAARAALRLNFLYHAVRLALQENNPGKAEALIVRHRAHLRPVQIGYPGHGEFPRKAVGDLNAAVVEAPIVHYLRRSDFAAARNWRARMKAIVGGEVGEEWAPLLATNYGEIFRPEVNDWRVFIDYGPIGPALDLLPASEMVHLARAPGMPAPARRALTGTAWVRLFALDRTADWRGIVPDLRRAFPEIAGDLDEIVNAGSDAERRFHAARILLANPGLGIFASRQHEIVSYIASSRHTPRRLAAIDAYNPNDGNWWCPLHPVGLEEQLAEQFFLAPTMSAIRGEVANSWPWSAGEHAPLGERLIATHPLLSAVDPREIDALSKVPSGPRQLASVVFAWDDRTRWLPRSQEESGRIAAALHHVVRATRYGCRREGSLRDISYKAYRRLHRRFPDSDWTRRTPYWFDL